MRFRHTDRQAVIAKPRVFGDALLRQRAVINPIRAINFRAMVSIFSLIEYSSGYRKRSLSATPKRLRRPLPSDRAFAALAEMIRDGPRPDRWMPKRDLSHQFKLRVRIRSEAIDRHHHRNAKFRAISACASIFSAPFSSSSRFSSTYSAANGAPAVTFGPPPCIFRRERSQPATTSGLLPGIAAFDIKELSMPMSAAKPLSVMTKSASFSAILSATIELLP